MVHRKLTVSIGYGSRRCHPGPIFRWYLPYRSTKRSLPVETTCTDEIHMAAVATKQQHAAAVVAIIILLGDVDDDDDAMASYGRVVASDVVIINNIVESNPIIAAVVCRRDNRSNLIVMDTKGLI